MMFSPVVRGSIGAVLLLLLGACSSIDYYSQLAHGQVSLLRARSRWPR
ncbi:hypothetical protein QNM99_05435 [Pseudomonas sp. PCH446]